MAPKVDRQKVLALLSEMSPAKVSACLGIHENTVRAIFRASRKACTRCTKPVIPGKTMCQECLENDRKRIMKRRKQRRRAGLCLECGFPRMDGSQFCSKHRDAAIERNERYQKRIKTLRGSPQGHAMSLKRKRASLVSNYGEDAWRRWEHAGGKCEICAAEYGDVAIHIHHVDEDRTHNTFENFICLCYQCHRAVHLLLDLKNLKAFTRWFEQIYPNHPLR